MPLELINFTSNAEILWHWPISIAIQNDSQWIQKILNEGRFSSMFTNVEVPDQPRHYNMLILDSELDYGANSNLRNCSFDVIILLGWQGGYHNSLRSLAKLLRAKGILVLRKRIFFSTNKWEKFLVELSHDNSIVNAISAVWKGNENGILLYDNRLLAETRITHFVKGLINQYPIHPESRRLSSDFADLDFMHETGASTDLAKLLRPYQKIPAPLPTIDTKSENRETHRRPKAKKMAMRRPKLDLEIQRFSELEKAELMAEILIPDAIAKELSEMTEEVAEMNENLSRYLQAKVETQDGKGVEEYLLPQTSYSIKIRIGAQDKAFVDTGTSFDERGFFDKNLTPQTIQLTYKSNMSEEVQLQEITLSPTGNSSLANIEFTTSRLLKVFKAEVSAFHKQRLVQQVRIKAHIGKPSGRKAKSKSAISMELVFSTKQDLSKMEERTDFSASVQYMENTKGTSTLQGIDKNGSIDIVVDEGMKSHLLEMKQKIEEALILGKNQSKGLFTKGNQELLLFLAMHGNILHTNLLKRRAADIEPLQIISSSQEYVPLEFVYSMKRPDDDATICKHAVQALKAGACQNCFDHSADPSPHICPFGFWTFSRVLERHRTNSSKGIQSGYLIKSEPVNGRDTLMILQSSLHGSSKRVETESTKGIRKQIAKAVKDSTINNSELADNWEEWAEKMQATTPDSLILVVHIDKANKFKIDQIEIGDKNFLRQNDFGSKLMGNQRDPVPFIVIIGCESTNVDSGGFDISSHLMNEGAAIVLSNFTKIRGYQAKEIVVKLLEFLKQIGKSGEESFGMTMLKLRQWLLSEGIVAGLSLVAHGDADWKIKT